MDWWQKSKSYKKITKKVKWVLNSILLVLGFASLAAYMKIGMENAKNGTFFFWSKICSYCKVMEFNTNKSVGGIA